MGSTTISLVDLLLWRETVKRRKLFLKDQGESASAEIRGEGDVQFVYPGQNFKVKKKKYTCTVSYHCVK